MKFSKIFWTVVILVLCLVTYDHYGRHPTRTEPETPVSTQSAFFIEETHFWVDVYNPTEPVYTEPSQEPYAGHIFTDARGKGDCKTLEGTLLINVLLVDDASSSWTDADAWDFHNDVQDANAKMIADAAGWGITLNVELNYLKCRVSETIDIQNHSSWVNEALRSAGLPTTDTISGIQEMYQFDHAAILFALNREGRSFANPQNQDHGLEYAVLFREQGDYRHELYHIYGAEDLYYPEYAKEHAQSCFGNSIMIDAAEGSVDGLTAYLLGWTDYPNGDARTFLNNTAWITQEYLEEALEAELVTGNTTIRWGEGTYTGDVVSGIPHGWGTVIWDNGDSYQGNWDNGVSEGYGTVNWASTGTRYTGEFRDGMLHGYGTYTFADGTTLTGQWANNEFVN